MLPAAAVIDSTRRSRAIDEAIHAIPVAWFKASPAIYWADFLMSAAIGWVALGSAVATRGWVRAALLAVAVFAFYRAVLFIHEITHRAKRDVPGFSVAWNALVGVPLLIPSFLYEGVHTDHHRQSSYGTEADPEYLPFGRRPPALLVGSVLASVLAPVVFAIRFGLLAPLSWLVPALRRTVVERYSALVINQRYLRRAPIAVGGRVQEMASAVLCWTALGLWWAGRLPTAAFLCWFTVSATVSLINALRTLAAHRYDHDAGELTMTDQLLDSCTIAVASRPIDALVTVAHALAAPVGLRYHALHHWIPSLPYHNLGRAHRLLATALRADAPYHVTVERGFTPAWRDLWRRSRARAR